MRISPVVRFLLACSLFAGWMGYLIFLAATSSKPIVLSRPQLLVSEVDVLAEVEAVDKPVVIKEILLAQVNDAALKPGKELRIANLGECKRLPHPGEVPEEVPLDWKGPGLYLLPLRATPDARGYVVVEVPASPGYPPREFARGTPRIYRATDEVMEEYRKFRAP
jgi:hypothetical protein